MDIVKPIPAKRETPKICFREESAGSGQSFVFTARNVKRLIPIILPNTRPQIMPILLGCNNDVNESGLILSAVFANANKGSMRNATK